MRLAPVPVPQVDTDVVQGVGGVLVTLIALFELYRNRALILELVRAVAAVFLPARPTHHSLACA